MNLGLSNCRGGLKIQKIRFVTERVYKVFFETLEV